jgi:hypothetical protein
MIRTAGIQPRFKSFVDLKQTLLLFDCIGIPFLEMDVAMARYIKSSWMETEFEFLLENKLLFNATPSGWISPYMHIPKVKEYVHESANEVLEGDGNFSPEVAVRLSSNIMNEVKGRSEMYCIPLLDTLKPVSNKTTETDVVRILIEQIPIPDDTTSWEAIMDYKQDEDNQGRMASLRKWIGKTVQSDLSPVYIKAEIDDLLYQYRKSLDYHKIKYKKGVLQTIVVGTAEFIENSLKFKLTNIAKGLFSLNTGKADLLNLELNAPGHELAYIYKTQEQFK